MAEAVFKHTVEKKGYGDFFSNIDSYGTGGWHVGDSPDSRSAKTCRKNGVAVNHRAQQIKPADFAKFDYVIAMDDANKSNLLHMRPRDNKAVVELFGKWGNDPQFKKIVDDPYYGGIDGFQTNFNQLCHFSERFLEEEIGPLWATNHK